MKHSFFKKSILFSTILLPMLLLAQDFQGKAYYFSKSTMELGSFGATMSEAQKKNEKNKTKQSKEDEKVDAISGATDSWGKNFTPGEQYKNIKTKELLQKQEFYGKQFLVKDDLLAIDWVTSSETKQIGKYICFKATASIPTSDLSWYDFSWDSLNANNNSKTTDSITNNSKTTDSINDSIKKEALILSEVVAWYSPQIPLSQGPLEYWGLPGLILEVNVGNTTILCSKIIMNPGEIQN